MFPRGTRRVHPKPRITEEIARGRSGTARSANGRAIVARTRGGLSAPAATRKNPAAVDRIAANTPTRHVVARAGRN
jgi:pyruvate kinase